MFYYILHKGCCTPFIRIILRKFIVFVTIVDNTFLKYIFPLLCEYIDHYCFYILNSHQTNFLTSFTQWSYLQILTVFSTNSHSFLSTIPNFSFFYSQVFITLFCLFFHWKNVLIWCSLEAVIIYISILLLNYNRLLIMFLSALSFDR